MVLTKIVGMIFDSKFSFNYHHLKEKVSMANDGIGTIRWLYKLLPRGTLINIYKAFVRPNLDYGDIIYDNSSNVNLSQMIESSQYNAALRWISTHFSIGGNRNGTYRDK